MFRPYRALALCGVSLLAFAATAEAQQATTAPEVVVSATRLETAPERVGSAVTVVPGADIERAGKPDVYGALQGVPGLSLSRNGGIGATSVVRVRGAEPGQTQVLIDGVMVNDPSSNDNAFNFDALAVTALDRIEVLRGPQSALYGNDAMGGVINVVTKRGRGPMTVNGMIEGGSFGTFRQGAGVSGGTDRVGYAVSASNFRTDGTSRLDETSEKDGARTRAVTGKLDADLTENWTVGLAAGVFDMRSDYDDFSRDAPNLSKKVLRYGKLENTVTLFDGRMENILTLSGTDTRRSFDEPRSSFAPHTNYDGARLSAEYRANVHVDEDDVLTLGASHVKESARIATTTRRATTVDLDDSVTTNAVYGQYLLGLCDRMYLTVGGRHDHHSQFGGKSTVRATGAYLFPDSGTKLRGSIGTAGKSPTLYNLYHPIYGNRDLKPESSVGADLGVEQTLLDQRLTGSVTVFWNRFTDLITFDGATSRYTNIDKARTAGVEAALSFQATKDLKLSASYTYTDSENLSTGRQLPRRPRHQASLGASWRAMEKLLVGGQLRFVGPQADSAFNTATNPAFTVVDAQASYAVIDNVSVYGRVENLFNADYTEVSRYASPSRGFYAGLRASF